MRVRIMDGLGYNLYWGDMHNNVRVENLDDVLRAARDILDFFAVAYYPFIWYTKKGLRIESCGERDEFFEDWRLVQEAVAEGNRPGEFVTFLGYEWHGDRRRYGDHNVYYLKDYEPLDGARTLPELYENLRKTEAMVIPHHTGYQVGERGKDWNFHDDDLSPLVEIYSGQHGSSEGCDTPLTMNRNVDMSPRTSGGTVIEGLDRGYRLGFIASSDLLYPGSGGLAGVYARELTRDSIWEAFMNRRTYGVTGDRIRLTFFINDHFMGETLKSSGPIKIWGEVVGSHAIDRVEIIRNGRVIHTYCHSGRWGYPETDKIIKAKLRLEFGWGPKLGYGLRRIREHLWRGSLEVDGGKIIDVEPHFNHFGQRIDSATEDACSWTMKTKPRMFQELIFELEAHLRSVITLEVNSRRVRFSMDDALKGSRVIALRREAEDLIRDEFGLSPGDVENPDVYWHNSYKVKIHRTIPEDGYTASFFYVDHKPRDGLNYYYLRVSQLNGQMAWSSPIWVRVP